MSVISSAFDLTGSYLATCVVALDAHQLKIQGVDPSSANAVSHSFTLEKNLRVNALKWGLFSNVTDSKLESQYIAICLNNGSVLIYSPAQNEVVSTLETTSTSAIVSFYHSKLSGTGFSVDVKGEINEWDLVNYKLIRSLKIPQLMSNNEQISCLMTIMYQNKIHLLIASYSIFLVQLETPGEVIHNFPGHVNPIHTILPISDDFFLTSADSDRFINIYSISKRTIEKVLVAQSNVTSISFGETRGKSIVVAVTEDNVELFDDPLLVTQESNGGNASKFSKKKKVKSKSKTSDATIKIARPSVNPTLEILKIFSTFVVQNQLIVTWLESSAVPFFDTLIWLDESGFKILGVTELIKAKPTIKLNDHSLHGHDLASLKHYNEGNAIIQMGDNFKDLESDAVEDDEETLAERALKLSDPTLQQSKEKKKKATTGTVTTILTQAIKSNDHALLETVLNNKDEEIVKNTIKKLSINYVIPLLNRISERIARNSSKQSVLNLWIKWLFIIHGGFLNSYSNLTQNLGILHSTLHRRLLTLPRLLELNGKIDMVLENMELKKMILKSKNSDYSDDLEEHESDVEYIEELEDHGLESGSEMASDEDQLDDYDESDSSESDLEMKDIDQEPENDEENYSDEEVAVKKINSDIDSDLEEQLALKQRILNLKRN